MSRAEAGEKGSVSGDEVFSLSDTGEQLLRDEGVWSPRVDDEYCARWY